MRDELDQLIDGALAEYSAAEPLAGLDQRVLNRVRDAERSRRWRWWGILALAAPAAAILVVSTGRKPERPPAVAVTAPPPPIVAVTSPPAAVRTPKPRRIAPNPRRLPKREMFPTPVPLTREERLLVQLAESRPAILGFKPVEAIEIKPIEIAPLETDGNQ